MSRSPLVNDVDSDDDDDDDDNGDTVQSLVAAAEARRSEALRRAEAASGTAAVGGARRVAHQWQPLGSPLDLVTQLRGDFEAYTRDVYGNGASSDTDSGGGGGLSSDGRSDELEALRARRQQERMQLESLHARLHGLRLILAMAQLNVAATSEVDRATGGGFEVFGEASPEDPNLVLVTLGRSQQPPEPVGVPEKRLEELVPASTAGKAEVDVTCSICICEIEEGEAVRKLPGCDHCFHTACIDRWFKRSVLCPNCKQAVCAPSTPPPRNAEPFGFGDGGGFAVEIVGSPSSVMAPFGGSGLGLSLTRGVGATGFAEREELRRSPISPMRNGGGAAGRSLGAAGTPLRSRGPILSEGEDALPFEPSRFFGGAAQQQQQEEQQQQQASTAAAAAASTAITSSASVAANAAASPSAAQSSGYLSSPPQGHLAGRLRPSQRPPSASRAVPTAATGSSTTGGSTAAAPDIAAEIAARLRWASPDAPAASAAARNASAASRNASAASRAAAASAPTRDAAAVAAAAAAASITANAAAYASASTAEST